MVDIDNLIKNATLSKDKVALNTYKNIKSLFQKIQTAKNYDDNWSENLEMQIISKYARLLEDDILQFKQANRDDLVAEYTAELEVIQKLLPEPVTAEDIKFHLYNWADELNYYGEISEEKITIAIPKKEMGKAIKFLKNKFPTADGKMISEIVKKYVK